MYNLRGFSASDSLQTIQEDIVSLVHDAGFKEVDEADVVVLLDSPGEDLTNEELIMLSHVCTAGEEEEENVEV